MSFADASGHLAPGAQGDYATQRDALAPIQAQGDLSGDVHAHAAHGVSGGGGTLPHAAAIQASFGRHDVSGVEAHTGGAAAAANDAMGAKAYATGNAIAFREAPSLLPLRLRVQQRAGVSWAVSVSEAAEQHADAVADQVVAGKSAEAS